MPKTEVTSKFFEFDQNNSGGGFDIDDKRGIGPRVYIEALNAGHANSLAEDIGIYFNGCEEGMDCPCCGDRWTPAWGDGEESIEISKYTFGWYDKIFVHRLNGGFETYTEESIKQLFQSTDERAMPFRIAAMQK